MIIRKNKDQLVEIATSRALVILAEGEVVIKRTSNDEEYIINGPGEYDIEEITIFAQDPFPSFMIDTEGINISYLPVKIEDLTDADEKSYGTLFEQTDILIIPGSNYELVNLLSPSYVIPIDNAAILAEKTGVDSPDTVKNLTVKSVLELPEKTEIISLG